MQFFDEGMKRIINNGGYVMNTSTSLTRRDDWDVIYPKHSGEYYYLRFSDKKEFVIFKIISGKYWDNAYHIQTLNGDDERDIIEVKTSKQHVEDDVYQLITELDA